MADYTWGSDDWLAMREEDRRDADQDARHASHYNNTLAFAQEGCPDCTSDVVNYPEEFIGGDDAIFWEVADRLCKHDPTEFDFVYQHELRALGLV